MFLQVIGKLVVGHELSEREGGGVDRLYILTWGGGSFHHGSEIIEVCRAHF